MNFENEEVEVDSGDDEIVIERRQADSENEADETDLLAAPLVDVTFDDKLDDEAPSVEQLELEDSTVIDDFPIESLHLYDDAFEWLLNSSHQYCFISVIGKSRFGKSLSQVLLPLLRPKRDFRRIAYFDECGIDFYWCAEEKTIFLVPKSTNDFATLIDLAERMNSAPSEATCHDIMKDSETKNALINLFLLSVCHLCLLIQPTTTLDLELDRWFRSIDECRRALAPSFAKLLGLLGVGEHWRKYGRPCPPRLLVLFEKCALSQEDLRDFADGDFARQKRKRVPQKRLVDSLQDQIYHIFRHSRLVTDSVVNNVFAIPHSDNYVLVLQPNDNKQMEEAMPIPAYLELLQESIRIQRETSETLRDGPPRWGKRRRCADLWLSSGEKREAEPKESAALQDGELWTFLSVHIKPILAGTGHNDVATRGRANRHTHFELGPAALLFRVTELLYRFIFLGQVPEQANDIDGKMITQLDNLKVQLRASLDPEFSFSKARCEKIVPDSHAAYLNSLPSHYTTKVHNNQIQQALLVYRQHARGPALEQYESQLKDKCLADWTNGRQLCEIRSLTDQHCIHKWHRLPGCHNEPDNDTKELDAQVMPHKSRNRFLATSNCGRMQAQRDDPFTLEEANVTFYAELDSKLSPSYAAVNFDTYNTAELIEEKLTALTLGDTNGVDSQQSQSGKSAPLDGHEMIDIVVPSHNTRYLKGMETSDSPKGMLPRFSSWSLLRTGAFGSYSELKGIEQPGFINRANFLLRWDISTSCRGFIGYEYETTRGARFFMQTPSKVVQGGSSALSAKVLLEHEFMPLFVPVPTAAVIGGGGGGISRQSSNQRQSGSIGQLMRIWFALPVDCKEQFVITPLVTPGRNAPTFKTTPDEIPLLANQISILRLPYVYMDENRVYHPPKEMADVVHFKVHKAIKTQKG